MLEAIVNIENIDTMIEGIMPPIWRLRHDYLCVIDQPFTNDTLDQKIMLEKLLKALHWPQAACAIEVHTKLDEHLMKIFHIRGIKKIIILGEGILEDCLQKRHAESMIIIPRLSEMQQDPEKKRTAWGLLMPFRSQGA